jgi:hypothetical protein
VGRIRAAQSENVAERSPWVVSQNTAAIASHSHFSENAVTALSISPAETHVRIRVSALA